MILFISNVVKCFDYAKANGFASLFRVVFRRLLFGLTDVARVRTLSDYGFVNAPLVGDVRLASSVSTTTINWFVPKVGRGSGGHLNIFRFIKHLESHGFSSRIIIIGVGDKNPEDLKSQITDWFFPLQAEVYTDAALAPPAYFSMATSWTTAYSVRSYLSTVKRCYFVQDFEPWFFPAGSDAVLAEATYGFGFFGFTAGSWLAEKLSKEYSMQTCAFGFSFDRDLYKPVPRVPRTSPRVFFYARPPTARRGFELGVLVLEAVSKRRPDVQIVMAGWDVRSYEMPFNVDHVGLVDLNDLPQLYRSCDVALVLSFTNASLLPLELMACGVPVVSNSGPFAEWLLNEQNAVLSSPNVEDLANSIIDLLESPLRVESLRQAGINFALQTSWEDQALIVVDKLHELSNSAG